MTRRWPPPLWLLLPLSVLTLGLAVLGLTLSELDAAANRFTDDAALQHTQSLAAFTAQQVEGALRRDESKAAAAATHGLNLDRDIGVAALIGPADVIIDATDFSLEGKALAATALATALPIIREVRATGHSSARLDRERDRVLAAFPVSMRSGPGAAFTSIGVLLVDEDLSFQRREAKRQVLVTSSRAALLLLLSALGVWLFLSRVVSRRLKQLVDAANRIEAGNLGARSDVHGGDEIAKLGRAFDLMAERLEANTAAIRESEERFRRLVEFGSDVMLTLDSAGRVVYLGASASRLLGWEMAEVVGAPLVSLLHPDDVSRIQPVLEEVTREPGFTRPLTVRARGRDGQWCALEAICHNPGDLQSGEQVIVNARDVSQRVALEEALRQSQKMDAVGQLAGGVAHDFNNLLTVIMANGEHLTETLDDEAREDAREIMVAARRAALLTQQLLAFSRRQTLRLEVVNLADVVTETHGLLRRLVDSDIAVGLSLDVPVAPVLADAGQLSQVILNLSLNARDAMPDGGQLTLRLYRRELTEADVTLRHSLRTGEYAVLEVIDTGIGMDAALRSRIFEPFFTTKTEGRGTGLGLATTYGIVTQLAGHVEVTSVPQQGSSFRVYLPLHAATRPAEAARPPLAPDVPHGTERLLLVEDDDALRALLARMAGRLGYVVHTARHGQEALEQLDARRFDLVFTDVRMPVMDGIVFAAEARARWPGLRIVFSSGFTAEGTDLEAALAQGGVFLPKPFNESGLAQALRSVLDAV